MAIKSKSRPKKSKQVARAPRAVPVEVRPPFFLRKRVQVTLAFVVGLLTAAVILWARNGLDEERAREERQKVAARARQAVGQYQSTIESALAPVGQVLSPGAFAAFVNLGTTLDDLEKGKGDPKEATETGVDVAKTASDASKAIADVDVSSLVGGKGFEFELVDSVFDSQDALVEALDLYGRAGELLRQAAEAEGAERDLLLEHAGAVLEIAQRVFQDGYADYTRALQKAGLATAPFAQPPTFPGP